MVLMLMCTFLLSYPETHRPVNETRENNPYGKEGVLQFEKVEHCRLFHTP